MTFPEAPALAHPRVRLEQLSIAHASDLSEAVTIGDLPGIWYTNIPSPAGMTTEIERRLGLQRDGRMAPFAIIDPVSERAIGMTTFMNIDAANRHVEIGSTWLAVPYQRTGVNRAAKLLLLTRAFEELDCISVEFRTHLSNAQSRAAITALGAQQDGILRCNQLDRAGNLRDTVVFSIIGSEWPDVKRRLIERLAT